MAKQYVISERDYNRIQQMLRWYERSRNPAEFFRRRNISAGGMLPQAAGKIFEIQSAAAGDGVYNCYEQTLDATEWTDTAGDDKFDDKNTDSVEVLNLLENDPVSDYTPGLGKYDRLQAWRMYDDEGNHRWVGIPLVNSVRQVKATEAAPAATNITCNLQLNNGAEAGSGELGYNIEIYARICGGGNLDDAVPRIASGDWLTAYNEQGKWWFDFSFNASINCACS